MSKQRSGNFFEDFEMGMMLRHATPRTITTGDCSLYIGLTGSRTALCTAETNAHTLGFTRMPVEDMLVFNMAFGKTVPDISLNAVANLGYADVQFKADVYPGDTISVESEVIGLKENSNRKSGIVYVHSVARNQHQEVVLSYIRWVMVHKRDPQASCGTPVIPTLPGAVDMTQMNISRYGAALQNIPSMTGINDLWDDYSAGERIDHPGAMTINNSDHSIATRLYQNTARGHFDGYSMTRNGSQRLVYGGHIISVCRALSYDGLENGLTIAAINGGRHVNPTYAEDTIACATTVLEKQDLNHPHIGALRLRLIGVKNADASSIVFPDPANTSPAHDASVVLDLDYTILMPKRSR